MSPARHTDDLSALVAAARRGDEAAWAELIRRLTPQLRRAAFRFGLNAFDVDDAVQQAWVQAYRKLDRLRADEAFVPWMLTTARRSALRIRQRGVAEIVTDTPLNEDAEDATLVWDEVLRTQRATAVREAVGRLNPRQRALIEALLAGDADYGGVAAKLGMPVGSIGPTLIRCKARMRSDAALIRAVAA
jgi:RNA polymerase sigma factor (sigma-70 family)